METASDRRHCDDQNEDRMHNRTRFAFSASLGAACPGRDGRGPTEFLAWHPGRTRKGHCTIKTDLPPPGPIPGSLPSAVACAASNLAADVRAAAIITFTQSGRTARLVSRCRPEPDHDALHARGKKRGGSWLSAGEFCRSWEMPYPARTK